MMHPTFIRLEEVRTSTDFLSRLIYHRRDELWPGLKATLVSWSQPLIGYTGILVLNIFLFSIFRPASLSASNQSSGLSSRRPGFAPGSVHVVSVVDKVALGQVFSELFGFPCHCYSTVAVHAHITWGMNSRPVSGRISETSSLHFDVNNSHV
jgi:hypothetical protein